MPSMGSDCHCYGSEYLTGREKASMGVFECPLHFRYHHRLKTFWGWLDQQLPDGTIVWTSPTGRIYRTTPGGPGLFPQMRPA